MAALAILQPDPRASAQLLGALGDSHRLIECASWEALEDLASSGEVEGCVLDVDPPDNHQAESRIRHLRHRFPIVAILAYVDPDRGELYYDLGGLGVDGLLISTARSATLRAEIDQALSASRGRRIAAEFEGGIRQPGPAALRWAVTNATLETSVERMAHELGLSTRALREDLSEVGLPSPARVLLWGRLLIAGARLGSDGRSVEEVAFALGYATTTSLARAMKQHTGYTPREVSERGGMALVQRALLDGHHRQGGLNRAASKFATALLSAALAGCATFGGSGVDRAAIRDVLRSPGIEQMHVGVLAVGANTGRVYFEHNAHRKFVPASNQKILVTATAMTMLGTDYRFRTELWSTGPPLGRYLDGDLVLVGSGDPTLSSRYWHSGTAALEGLADSLRASGIDYVAGDLIVDASAWDSATVGPTWEVEDLRFAYGSTGGAFAIDEGEIEIVVEAGPLVGSPARARWSPVGTHGYVRSHLATAPRDSSTRVRPSYLPESRRLELHGRVELGTADTLSFALRDPVRQASAVLARVIQGAGIDVEGGWEVRWARGEALGRGCVAGSIESCESAQRLVAIVSPPLAEIAAGILEPSQNWMTEQLLRSLGALFGEQGSWSEGVRLMHAFLFEHVGVDTLDVSARDGSGLSAYNLVTPRAVVHVLKHMHDGPYAQAFRAAMAEPGEEDSSLERRLDGLEGRVFAKTGTISNVNSLSGYLVREGGEDIIFSILTNGSGLPASFVRARIDDIVLALAGRAAAATTMVNGGT